MTHASRAELSRFRSVRASSLSIRRAKPGISLDTDILLLLLITEQMSDQHQWENKRRLQLSPLRQHMIFTYCLSALNWYVFDSCGCTLGECGLGGGGCGEGVLLDPLSGCMMTWNHLVLSSENNFLFINIRLWQSELRNRWVIAVITWVKNSHIGSNLGLSRNSQHNNTDARPIYIIMKTINAYHSAVGS